MFHKIKAEQKYIRVYYDILTNTLYPLPNIVSRVLGYVFSSVRDGC